MLCGFFASVLLRKAALEIPSRLLGQLEMLIRRGRDEGWLQQPISNLQTWAAFNGVSFNGVQTNVITGAELKGSAVVATRPLIDSEDGPLMKVPGRLVLSLGSVDELAKSDRHLSDVLGALGAFGRTSRGAVLIFLLMQATVACPDIPHGIGVVSALTEYIKFLPAELLPTFWTEAEQELLIGTSLRPAVNAKLKSLAREFDHVREATLKIDWCNTYWWSGGSVTLDDWKHLDAMYRSRALEFPGIGDAMVPCIDMANHASGDATTALYESDGQGNALLLLREGKSMQEGEEVTITYGDQKGACEMIFSYGFLEETMGSAGAVFLDLRIPDDDPLRIPKMSVCTSAPGFRLFDHDNKPSWESDYIWLVVVNEEDGLSFDYAQTIDGQHELKALWRGNELVDTTDLAGLLKGESTYEVFVLRAVSLIQDRVEQQLHLLYGNGQEDQPNDPSDSFVRDGPKALASKLRMLEQELLERSYGELEDQKLKLLEAHSVQQYLASQQGGLPVEDDFS